MYAAVPPLATSSTPSSASPRANASSSVLSYTDRSARSIIALDELAHDTGEKAVLDRVQAVAQLLHALARDDRHALLRDDRTGVDALVHEVDGNAGLGRTGLERVVDRPRAGERGQQRRVDVDDRCRENGRGTPA